MVGAIHGRLLSAWATAGVLGPVIVNYMRDYLRIHLLLLRFHQLELLSLIFYSFIF